MEPPSLSTPNPLPPHPRLLVCPEDWLRIRQSVGQDDVSARIFATLRSKAEGFLEAPLLEREKIGFRLLPISRKALERISVLAMVAQVDGDPRFARRAIGEMIQVANFSDWNPAHYLDVAEMSLAVAIGYDWLHDFLSEDERSVLATALREKGIEPSLQEPEQWFIRGNNNWNQVCHAGVSAAAIAIADTEPELCQAMLSRAVEFLPNAAIAYAPDGAYPEGPMYWNYGTLYHVVLAASLERFCGSTLGTDAYEGFAASAEYVAQTTMPAGNVFAYADCRRTRHLLIPLFWFARKFSRPDWLEEDLQNLSHFMGLYESGGYDDSNYRLLSLALLWRDVQATKKKEKEKARHWLGLGPMPVAAHRSAFGDPDALYAAIKGGSPSLNHAHMDGGSFVIQAEGVDWAVDLGMQEYDSLESINVNVWDAQENGMRWNIFRLGPDSHNILRFNGTPQALNGSGSFVRFQADGPAPHSVLDLTSLYADQTENVHRGLMFLENRAIMIQDEWTTGALPAVVEWQMLTTASVDIRTPEIILSQDGKTLRLRILNPQSVEVECLETSEIEKPFDAPNPDTRRLIIRMRTSERSQACLRILAQPGTGAPVANPPLQSALDWSRPISDLPR